MKLDISPVLSPNSSNINGCIQKILGCCQESEQRRTLNKIWCWIHRPKHSSLHPEHHTSKTQSIGELQRCFQQSWCDYSCMLNVRNLHPASDSYKAALWSALQWCTTYHTIATFDNIDQTCTPPCRPDTPSSRMVGSFIPQPRPTHRTALNPP